MNEDKMYRDNDARLHLERLPFSARLWSVQRDNTVYREWGRSQRYHTREHFYKRYYKFISRRACHE